MPLSAPLSPEAPAFWTALETRSWNELLAEKWGDHASPLTVHLPIQPPHSPDAVHVGAAFEVGRRRILAGLNAHNVDEARSAAELETLVVQFAFGAAPSVPDFRRTSLTIEPDGVPIARAELYAYEGLLYQFEYFCSPLDDPARSILWIRGRVTNRKTVALPAHVRVKVNCAPENQLYEYHYAPYFWDAAKYLPSPDIGLNGNSITRNGKQIGTVKGGDFDVRWEDHVQLPPDAYPAADFQFSPPHASLRLPDLQHVIHLSSQLEPGETREFTLAFLTAYEDATREEVAALGNADIDAARVTARTSFAAVRPANAAELLCPIHEWDTIFAHLPLSIAQLLIRFSGTDGLVPTQGGTSERHFVWVGEAAFQLLPLLKLGYFDLVKNALTYIFSFQDSASGFTPHGRLTSTAGAIGTSGPKWLNSTGMALVVAAEYQLYARNEAFEQEYAPRIVRAMDWIVRELRATRQLNADGTRPGWYGLMPFGCATDGDIGYIVAYTDSFTFLGLEKSVLMLERLGHERAGEFRAELEAYRVDFNAAIECLSRDDGYIDRKFVTGDPDEELYEPFDQICGAYHVAAGGAARVESPVFQRYIAYFERMMGKSLFSGQMDDDTMYIGVGEWVWQEIYMRRGEWKKAFATTQINLRYGKSRGAHQVQERVRLSDPSFTPWQPNGSGGGRVLDMMLKAFVFEYRGVATLLGGIPFAWLRRNGVTELKDFHTPAGRLCLSARMLDDARCELLVIGDSSAALPIRVALPGHFAVLEHDGEMAAGQACKGVVFSASSGAATMRFVVGDREAAN